MAHPSSSLSSLVIIPLEPSLLPACSWSLSVAEMRGSVSPRFLWLRCKCPLTELRLHIALPLLQCIPVPIFEGLCKGLVPFYWMGLEPERGFRFQRKGCGAVTHMVLWGSSFLPMYPTIMKAWTPIVLLMSARNFLMTLGRFQAFLIHDRDEDQSELSGRMRYLLSLLFVQWAFLIPFICQLLHLPPFLLAQAFKGCGQASGYAARYVGVPFAAF